MRAYVCYRSCGCIQGVIYDHKDMPEVVQEQLNHARSENLMIRTQDLPVSSRPPVRWNCARHADQPSPKGGKV